LGPAAEVQRGVVDMGVAMTILMVVMMVLMVGAMSWGVLSSRIRGMGRPRSTDARLPNRRGVHAVPTLTRRQTSHFCTQNRDSKSSETDYLCRERSSGSSTLFRRSRATTLRFARDLLGSPTENRANSPRGVRVVTDVAT
jgi:hypothetical protein